MFYKNRGLIQVVKYCDIDWQAHLSKNALLQDIVHLLEEI